MSVPAEVLHQAIRDAAGPVRVSDLCARYAIGPIAIWQHLNRLEARGLIHITAAGEPFVSVPKAPPARQLTLEGDPA